MSMEDTADAAGPTSMDQVIRAHLSERKGPLTERIRARLFGAAPTEEDTEEGNTAA